MPTKTPEGGKRPFLPPPVLPGAYASVDGKLFSVQGFFTCKQKFSDGLFARNNLHREIFSAP